MAKEMKNVSMEVNGTELVIKIDLAQNFGMSSSGKSITIATTSGNVAVPGTQVRLGINAYVPAKAMTPAK